MKTSHLLPLIHVRTTPEKPVVKKRTKRGYQLGPTNCHGKTLLTDQQVGEARWLWENRETTGVTKAELAERYGTSRDYMYVLLDYTTRSKIEPRKPENL